MNERVGIYLDNAATSFPKPPEVIEAVSSYMRDNGASVGRGDYQKAKVAGRVVERVRQLICTLFNYHDPNRVVFTSNVTEAINLAIYGLVNAGDQIITTQLEHNAVWRCLKRMEKERGAKIAIIPSCAHGKVNVAELEQRITPQTKLVVINHASNVTGIVQPIGDIGAITRKHNIPLLVDSAQTAGVYPIDMQDENIDLLTFTGHKGLLGPMGTGGLVINWDYQKIKPFKMGGTGSNSVEECQPDFLPDKFEVGTLNVAGLAGLEKAVEFLLTVGIANIRKKEEELTGYTLNKLEEIKQATVYGPQDAAKMVGVVSFNLENIPPEEVAYVLDQAFDIMVRAGLHCSPCAHRMIGTEKSGTVRIGLGYFNTIEDIDQLIFGLREILNL